MQTEYECLPVHTRCTATYLVVIMVHISLEVNMLGKGAATLTHNLYIGAGAIGCHRYTHGQWWALSACTNSHTRAFCMSRVPGVTEKKLAGVTEKKLATNNCYS